MFNPTLATQRVHSFQTGKIDNIRQPIATVLLAIIGVKILLLMLDPNPRFFLWDSVTYLRGALEGTLPRDRSFLYSLLIGAIAVPARSLHALVIAQSIAGAASAFIVFVILRYLLDARYFIALIAALLVAIEPGQLFYERMVMAEAFGSLTWLGFIALALAYCRDGRVFWLPLVALAGIVAVSFRLNGTFTVLTVGAFLPIWRMLFIRSRNTNTTPTSLSRMLMHLSLAILATASLHTGYRHLVGAIAHTPPGYIGTAGLFTLGFVAPLIEEEHFRDTGCNPAILQHFSLPLRDPTNREGQLWGTDGLWPAMQRECPQPETAATLVAQRALAAHPWAIFPMAFTTAAQYFDSEEAQWRMDSDLGRKGAMPIEIIEPAREHFFLEASAIPGVDSLTSLMFQHSRWWITLCFFMLPSLAIGLLLYRKNDRSDSVTRGLALIAFCLFLSQFFLSPIISFRYLHPFPPLLIILVLAIGTRRFR